MQNIHITFKIQYKVDFGNSVYVSGNIQKLGNWDINHALRLNWEENDFWSNEIVIQKENQDKIDYKYIIGDFQNISSQPVLWEKGPNRNILLKTKQQSKSSICPLISILRDDKWEQRKIIIKLVDNIINNKQNNNNNNLNLNLIKKKINEQEQNQFYVKGNFSSYNSDKTNVPIKMIFKKQQQQQQQQQIQIQVKQQQQEQEQKILNNNNNLTENKNSIQNNNNLICSKCNKSQQQSQFQNQETLNFHEPIQANNPSQPQMCEITKKKSLICKSCTQLQQQQNKDQQTLQYQQQQLQSQNKPLLYQQYKMEKPTSFQQHYMQTQLLPSEQIQSQQMQQTQQQQKSLQIQQINNNINQQQQQQCINNNNEQLLLNNNNNNNNNNNKNNNNSKNDTEITQQDIDNQIQEGWWETEGWVDIQHTQKVKYCFQKIINNQLITDRQVRKIDISTYFQERDKLVLANTQPIFQFKFSKVNTNIFLGPYPQGKNDIEQMKKAGIQSVLNLQTQLDMSWRGINWEKQQKMYEQNNIRAYNFPIIDMDCQDMSQKLIQVSQLLHLILQSYSNVYVHCTAGIFRSPQAVIGYFCFFKKYEINQAIKLVEQRHPVSKKNRNYMKRVFEILSQSSNEEIDLNSSNNSNSSITNQIQNQEENIQNSLNKKIQSQSNGVKTNNNYNFYQKNYSQQQTNENSNNITSGFDFWKINFGSEPSNSGNNSNNNSFAYNNNTTNNNNNLNSEVQNNLSNILNGKINKIFQKSQQQQYSNNNQIIKNTSINNGFFHQQSGQQQQQQKNYNVNGGQQLYQSDSDKDIMKYWKSTGFDSNQNSRKNSQNNINNNNNNSNGSINGMRGSSTQKKKSNGNFAKIDSTNNLLYNYGFNNTDSNGNFCEESLLRN